MENKKYANVKVDLKSLFRWYLEFTKPVHKLRKQEIDVLSLLLYYNHQETPNFKRDEDRWKKVFELDTKKKIMKEIQMNSNVFQNVLSSLRKKGVVKKDGYNYIVNNYIPVLTDDVKSFQLIINFIFKNE